jgi:hypothetical protein
VRVGPRLVQFAFVVEVGVELVGAGVKIAGLGPAPLCLEPLLLGGKLFAPGAGGSLVGLGGLTVRLHLGDVGQATMLIRLVAT